MLPPEEDIAMMGPRRSAAAFLTIVVLSGATTLLSRTAAAAEPTVAECLAAYDDSLTLRRKSQLRATRAKLVICSSQSCPAEIRSECAGRVRDIDASMPTVVFDARDAAGLDLVAVIVKMDGELLAERLQGSALPIDPGEHTFTFEVAGRASVEKRLLILEGEKLRREHVEFAALAPPKPPVPSPVTEAKSVVREQPGQSPPPKPGWARSRTLALALGGVGVAATGLGVAYSLIAMSRRETANNLCPTTQCTGQDGLDAWSSANTAGNIATGAFIVGAAGLASGLVIWLRAKPAADTAPGAQISLGPAGLQVGGKW
jgi:hypothetical protein